MNQQSLIPAGSELQRSFATIVLKPQQELLDKVRDDIDDASSIVIDSDFMAAEAIEAAGRLSTVHATLDAERLNTTKPLRDGQAWVNAGYDPALKALTAAKDAYTTKLTAWNKEVARKKAEAEAEARRQRDAEALRQREAADKLAAEAATLAAQAQAAQASGDAASAAALVDQAQAASDASAAIAEIASVAATAQVVVRGGGLSSVKGATSAWKAEVTNKVLLIAHIGKKLLESGDVTLLNLLDINESNLNALAKVMKADLQLPGVETYTADSVRVRKSAVN